MSVDLRKRSRLRFANLQLIDGYEFWDLFEPPVIPPQPDDAFYRIKAGDRIDLLANTFYGDPILWWVIALANDLELLPTEINEGDVIRIPSSRFVSQVLFTHVIQ